MDVPTSDENARRFNELAADAIAKPPQNSRRWREFDEWLESLVGPAGGTEIGKPGNEGVRLTQPGFIGDQVNRTAVAFIPDEAAVDSVVNGINSAYANGRLDHLNGVCVAVNDSGRWRISRVLQPVGSSAHSLVSENIFPDAEVQTVYAAAESSEREIRERGTAFESVGELVLGDRDPCGLYGLGPAFEKAIFALKSGKHVILTGPPGTGKTELASCICKTLSVEYDIATATSDWSTFDTVGGYLPDPSIGNEYSEPLNFFPGVVTRSILENRWLIIDEINRADIDKAFGELFTFLSGSSVRLPYQKRDEDGTRRDVILGDAGNEDSSYQIHLPPDWRLIGTMNTFDKASLYQMSFAFMRRFSFIEVSAPDQSRFGALIDRWLEAIEDAAFRAECSVHLKKFFVPATGEGLDAIALTVGPAIAIDVIKYLSMVDPGSSDASLRVQEAIEMFVFPQFEGQDRLHQEILDLVCSVLNLDGVRRNTISKRLGTWTGYIELSS